MGTWASLFQVIPNSDERCTWGWSFDDALRAMVFTLAAVCTILLCIGCIRYTVLMRKLKFPCSLLGVSSVRPLKPLMKCI